MKRGDILSKQELEIIFHDLLKYKDIIKFNLNFTDFNNNLELFNNYFGNNGFVMFTGNEAVVCFDKYTNIRFYLMNKKNYIKKDFINDEIKLRIIGIGSKDIKSPLLMLIEDIKINFFKILIFTLIYAIIINPFIINFDQLNLLNDKLIDITSIFIGMVFVFIGFFYGDKERTISVYKKGIGDKEYKTDKYVIELSLCTIVLTLISILVGNLNRDKLPIFLFEIQLIDNVLSIRLQYLICLILTWLAICFIIICFDSLTNYYLKTMRNKYFIDAVDEIAKEIKEKLK